MIVTRRISRVVNQSLLYLLSYSTSRDKEISSCLVGISEQVQLEIRCCKSYHLAVNTRIQLIECSNEVANAEKGECSHD